LVCLIVSFFTITQATNSLKILQPVTKTEVEEKTAVGEIVLDEITATDPDLTADIHFSLQVETLLGVNKRTRLPVRISRAQNPLVADEISGLVCSFIIAVYAYILTCSDYR